MNIFFLCALRCGADLRLLARMYHKKHQKIILEIAQMLSTAVHVNLPEECADRVYKPSHRHHPMTLWVCASPYNALLAIRIAHALDGRFRKERKSGKPHASMAVVKCVSRLLVQHWDAMVNPQALERLQSQTTATLCPVEGWVLPVTPIPACVGGPVDSPNLVVQYKQYYASKLSAWGE